VGVCPYTSLRRVEGGGGLTHWIFSFSQYTGRKWRKGQRGRQILKVTGFAQPTKKGKKGGLEQRIWGREKGAKLSKHWKKEEKLPTFLTGRTQKDAARI